VQGSKTSWYFAIYKKEEKVDANDTLSNIPPIDFKEAIAYMCVLFSNVLMLSRQQ
jgi:hypothetical protein